MGGGTYQSHDVRVSLLGQLLTVLSKTVAFKYDAEVDKLRCASFWAEVQIISGRFNYFQEGNGLMLNDARLILDSTDREF